MNAKATQSLTLRSLVGAWRRMARARALVEAGAGLEWYAASGSSEAPTRAARLYRRALRLVGAQGQAGNVATLRAQAHQQTRWRRLWPEPPFPSLPPVRGRTVVVVAAVVLAVLLLRRPVADALSRDLAANASWRASSVEYLPAAEGQKPTATGGAAYFLHTMEEKGPSVIVDLGAPQRIGRVQVLNRTDCCAERAVPMVIDTSVDGRVWRQVGSRRMSFDTWDHRFATVTARYVRLRVDRLSVLHLSAIRVFP